VIGLPCQPPSLPRLSSPNSTRALKESAAANEHFLDLGQLVGHPTPAIADAEGTSFTFEYGAAMPAVGIAEPPADPSAPRPQ